MQPAQRPFQSPCFCFQADEGGNGNGRVDFDEFVHVLLDEQEVNRSVAQMDADFQQLKARKAVNTVSSPPPTSSSSFYSWPFGAISWPKTLSEMVVLGIRSQVWMSK